MGDDFAETGALSPGVKPPANPVTSDIRRGSLPRNSVYILLCGIAITYFMLVVAAFAGLIPLGYWHDEFTIFAGIRSGGMHFCIALLAGWIPRPLSDLFVLIYGWSAIAAGRELMTGALAPVWFLLFACTALAPFAFFRHANLTAKFGLGVLTMALMCSFLLGHPISEAFYWPMAAFAYLPTLAAVTLLLWSLLWSSLKASLEAGSTGGVLRPNSKRGVALVRGGALLVAAWSSEIGAIFTFIFTSVAMGAPIVFSLLRGKRPTQWMAMPKLWLAVPLAGAIWVLYRVAVGRAADAHEGAGLGDYAVRHHVINALLATGPGFMHEMFSLDANTAASLATKAIFLAGAYLALSMLPRQSARLGSGQREGYYLINLVFAAVTTFFATIAAAFYQYGMDCCQHHATTRQDLIFIALVAAAGVPLAFGYGTIRQNWARGGAALVCLVLAVTIPMFKAAPQLAADYMDYHTMRSARVANWRSGLSAGTSMVFMVPAQGQVVGGLYGVNGAYTLGGTTAVPLDARPYVQLGMLQYFNKQSVSIIPADGTVALANITPLVRLFAISRFRRVKSPGRQPTPSQACALNPIDSQAFGPGLTVPVRNVVPISGWALMNGMARLPSAVSLTLHGAASDFSVPAVRGDLRTDVTDYFHLPKTLHPSGFHVNTDFSRVPNGQYLLSVRVSRGRFVQTCGAYPITITRAGAAD